MSRISIIVPVYNVEKYLPRCLDSIRRQTLSDFECILVDDGSTDSSLSICNYYASLDPRFKVIHKENGGVSSARNIGLERAVGTYIGFVDSDDWIEDNMYASMYRDALETDSDIVVAGVDCYNRGKNKALLSSYHGLMTMFNPQSHMDGFSVTRLIKREIVGATRYDESIGYLEDINFFYYIYKKAKSIYWHDVPYYHYEVREDAATSSYLLNDNMRRGIETLEKTAESEENSALKKCMKGFIYCWKLGTAINYISHCNTSSPDYEYVSKDVPDKTHLPLCTFRERMWRHIILHPWLQKLYWAIKRKPGAECSRDGNIR